MDKGWMSKHRLSRDYEDGVELFLQFALQNCKDPNQIPCPCAKCGNLKKKNVFTIRAHLCGYGMDLTYHIWIFHGEKSDFTSIVDEIDTVWEGEVHGEDQEGDNDEDKGDNDEDLGDMVDDAFDNFKQNPMNFRKLLEDAEKPLYPGNLKFTKLSTIVKLYNLKAKYGWSDSSFNDLLSLLGDILPEGHELPSSLFHAKKSLCTLGMSYEKIHACPNDCILYRNMHKKAENCPSCGLSRWKKVGKMKELNVGVPAKVLWYFSPKPRFLRMYRNKEMARQLTWHADERKCDGYLRHPADTPAWRLVDRKWPDFASESRNLRLAISADGINPHGTMSSNYSCWPVLLVSYNLPPWLCMKRKFMMLTLLISGPKQPGNDIDVFLAPLIDDLKELWEIGIQAYDAYREESFTLRAVLLWTINDFPAYGNLSGCSVKGYLACPICGEETYAKRLAHGRKMSYTGHRRFLPKDHPYRKQKKAFNGQQEVNPPPRPLTGLEIYERVKNINCVWGEIKVKKMLAREKKEKQKFEQKQKHVKLGGKRKVRKKAKEDVAKSSGKMKEKKAVEEDKSCWKKKSIFFDLAYWKHLHVRHILDVMHIEKNICESVIGTLLDIPGKTKDGIAARLDLVDLGVRTELAPKVGEKRTFLPPACYTLSKEEKRSMCSSLLGMKVPMGYSSNIANLVSIDDLKLGGLKSHDYHTLMQQLLPIAIRGILPKHVRYTITRLCLFFNVLCDKVVDVSKLDEIQIDIVITLCLLEKEFPPSFFDIMIHLVVHLVREVKLCGPVWYRWMYPFERFMSVLKGYVRNRNRPEGCIAEGYIVEEAVEFCADFLSNVSTVGIPSSNLQAGLTRPLSSSQFQMISDEEWDQAHLYVLTNDFEIDPYIEEHKEHLKAAFPSKARSKKWLQDEHNKSFIVWLRARINSTIATESSTEAHSSQISTKVKWMSRGPSRGILTYQSYLINGITYCTKERDRLRTVQNSGVSVVAKTMQVASAKDKNPIVSDMLFYGVIEEIWELDYTTFRVVMFKCNWVDNNCVRVDDLGFILVNLNRIGFKSDPFILGSQAKQVFYVEDPQDPTMAVVLACPKQEYLEFVNGPDTDDNALNHSGFTKGLPTMNLNDELDDNELSCIRKDCDGTWVNNEKS